MDDIMSKGIQKFCSYFILRCKRCGEKFTILRDCPSNPFISSPEKGVTYCPFCGKKSKPELWTKLK